MAATEIQPNKFSAFLWRRSLTVSELAGWCNKDPHWAIQQLTSMFAKGSAKLQSTKPLRFQLVSKGQFTIRWQHPKPGAYLKSFDQGVITWTSDPKESFRFESPWAAEALSAALKGRYPLELTDKTLDVERVKK
jgi:hypothetical protein